jgi:hypothetical protein
MKQLLFSVITVLSLSLLLLPPSSSAAPERAPGYGGGGMGVDRGRRKKSLQI